MRVFFFPLVNHAVAVRLFDVFFVLYENTLPFRTSPSRTPARSFLLCAVRSKVTEEVP